MSREIETNPYLDPGDISPLDVYEMVEYVGMQAKCNRCHTVYFVPSTDRGYAHGYCSDDKCGGWVSIPPKLNKAFVDANIYKLHRERCKI